MKRLLTFVAILITVGVVYSLIARERSILQAAEERARRAEATARDALQRARQASQSVAPATDPFFPQSEPGLSFAQPTSESAPPLDLQAFGQVDPLNGLEALRQKYVEQQAVKALLMQAEDLRSALDATNSEIRELDAQARLKDVSETLARIAEEFNGTQAAPLAERMLELYRNPHQDAPEPGTNDAVEQPPAQKVPSVEAPGI
jgi:hypothetical protein